MPRISRRSFLKAGGAAVVAGPAAGTVIPGAAAGGVAASAVAASLAGPAVAETAPAAPARRGASSYTFLRPDEASFIEPAVERLIPSDETGPGALEAGVPSFIDKQLGGAWGAGERLYRSGPWRQGTPSQGYQLPFTPAELFRNALRGVREELAGRYKSPFGSLPPAEQDAYLTSLQERSTELAGVPANVFFESLLALTIEGYFSDPVYGGNTDMASWKMIGFPGAYAEYYQLVDQHGIDYVRAPMSLAEDGRGKIHLHPNIPASLRRGGA